MDSEWPHAAGINTLQTSTNPHLRSGDFNSVERSAGPSYFRKNGVVTRIEALYATRNRLVLEVQAAGEDPENPTQFDRLHAAVSTCLVLQQPGYDRYLGNTQTSLAYCTGARVPIVFDPADIGAKIQEVLDDINNSCHPPLPIPSPLLAFLIDRG